jgi:hypothetical protein
MQELDHVVLPAVLYLATHLIPVSYFIYGTVANLKRAPGLYIRLVYGLPFRGTLMVTHDRTRNNTYAICFGIASEHAHRLVERLEESQTYAFSPLHVACLLANIALEDLDQFSNDTYHDFTSVREAMGTNLYSLYAENFVRSPDLADMPRRLTALANALASNCSSLRGVSDIVDTMESYLKAAPQNGNNDDPADIDMYADRLSLMHQIVKCALRRNEYVKESVQAQVQMVRNHLWFELKSSLMITGLRASSPAR